MNKTHTRPGRGRNVAATRGGEELLEAAQEIEQHAAPAPMEPVGVPVAPKKALGAGLAAGLIKFVWVATVLVWPILKWVLSIITFFQFMRMLYYWHTPGVYAGWSFLAHFVALTAITYFVSIYKPKGL